MSIELRCSQCDTLLRVPDGSEGRQTRCPSCQVMLRVPGTSPSQYPDSQYPGEGGGGYPPGGAASAEREANPFMAPTTTPQTSGMGSSPFAGSAPAQLDLGDLLSQSWDLFTRNIGQCLGGWLIVTLGWGIPMMLAVGVMTFAVLLSSNGMKNDEVALLVGIPLGLMCAVVIGFIYSWLSVGWLRFILSVARTGSGDFGLIFSGGDGMMSYFFSGILMSLAITLGYAACIVPGVILLVMFSQRGWLIADRGLGALDSLGQSNNITNGHKLYLFLLFVLQMVVGFALGFVPYVGPILNLLLVQPYFFVVFAATYLTLTGQPVMRYRPLSQPFAPAAPPIGGAPGGTSPPPPDFG
ncbi:MAG: hypothetical protein KDA63_05085 [Planctomycetales bacterium]|nr:hypothetical protein [Planctomycetales bacterium]